jgi:hypothetical protein
MHYISLHFFAYLTYTPILARSAFQSSHWKEKEKKAKKRKKMKNYLQQKFWQKNILRWGG